MLRFVECAKLQVFFEVVMADERHEHRQKEHESFDESANITDSIP